MSDLGLTHIALPARDLERSIDFYARYAQMQVVHRRRGVVWLSDKTRPFALVLMESEAIAQPLGPAAHLGVACESRECIDRLCARATAEGMRVDGPTDSPAPVGYWALIHDPDGHTLELSHGQDVGLTVERVRRDPTPSA